MEICIAVANWAKGPMTGVPSAPVFPVLRAGEAAQAGRTETEKVSGSAATGGATPTGTAEAAVWG